MNSQEFLKMVVMMNMNKENFEDFSYELNGKLYAFKDITDDQWKDEGKYQYKTEKGQLVILDSKFKISEEFNLGVSRVVQRSGSYFSSYHYEYEGYEPFEIIEVLIPEVVIPAHFEKREVVLSIPKSILKEVEKEKKLEKERKEEQKRIEEEERIRQEELKKKYAMNDSIIIQRVSKILKKKNKSFTLKDMQREYFNIIEKEGLKDEEWLDYHRNKTLV